MCLRSPESLFCFFLFLLTFHHFSIDKEEYKTNSGCSLSSDFIESQQASGNSFLSCLCHMQSAFSEVAIVHFRCLFRCPITSACGNDASAQVQDTGAVRHALSSGQQGQKLCKQLCHLHSSLPTASGRTALISTFQQRFQQFLITLDECLGSPRIIPRQHVLMNS